MGITILCRARFSLCTVWLFSKRITAELPPSGKLHWIWLTPLESWWPVCKDPRQRLGKPEASKGVTEIRCTHLWSVCRPPGEMLSRGAGGISIPIDWTAWDQLCHRVVNEIVLVGSGMKRSYDSRTTGHTDEDWFIGHFCDNRMP